MNFKKKKREKKATEMRISKETEENLLEQYKEIRGVLYNRSQRKRGFKKQIMHTKYLTKWLEYGAH